MKPDWLARSMAFAALAATVKPGAYALVLVFASFVSIALWMADVIEAWKERA